MWGIIFWVLAITVILWWALKFFAEKKILDKPGKDQKTKRKPVPTILWIAIFVAFLAFIGIAFPEIFVSRLFLGLIAGSGVIIGVSFLDELNYIWKIKLKIPIWVRVISHIVWAIVAVLVWWLEMNELIIWNSLFIVPGRIFMIFFVIWSFVCINAINWFDYGNWQASGISAIGFSSIVLLISFVTLKVYTKISPEHLEILKTVQILGITLFGLSTISAIIEWKPIWLIRDVWTMFFGFALAYLSVLWWTKIGTLVIVLSLVIFDAIWVGLHRIFFLKKNPARWDYNHIHHRLIGLGWSKWEVRFFVWIWSIIMMILILIQGADRLNKIVIFVLMASIFFGINAYLFRWKKLPCGLEGEKQ